MCAKSCGLANGLCKKKEREIEATTKEWQIMKNKNNAEWEQYATKKCTV